MAEIPTLTRLCLDRIVSLIIAEENYHKTIKEFCRVIPSHLLVPVFDMLQEKGVPTTDIILLMSLVPNRTKLILSSAFHIRNSILKQIGYNCPYLKCLNLSDCVQVSNTVVRIVLQGCPQLADLNLDRCHRVTDAAFDMSESPFEALVGCLSLQAISLQGCPQITGEIVTTLNKLCGQLTYLNLSQCKQIAPTAIKQVFEHHQIVALNLSFLDNGCVTDDAFLSFPVLTSLVNPSKPIARSPLRKLNLGKSIISDLSMSRMAFLSGLVEIRLQWCQGITDAGIRSLTINCPRLRLIDLKSCLISDDGVMWIAKDSKYIKTLDLSWCSKLTNACLGYLVSYQHSGESGEKSASGLESLSLVWCSNMTDGGVSCLTELPSLKTVDLSGCLEISKECIEVLISSGIQVVQ